MGQKLHRGRRNVFRKRRTGLRTFAWILTAVLIVAGGYFAASLLNQKGNPATDADTKPSASQSVTTTPSTVPSDPADPQEDTPATVTDGIKGFYLPFSTLSADTLSETSLLGDAKAAGYNAVIFDLKDEEGRLYYQFADPTAQKVGSYVDNALTKKQLTTLFKTFKEHGLTPIPRLHAFKDNLGAKALQNARISFKENPSWSWMDGKDSATAKRWLSPYDNDAHDYLGGLATELKKLGAGAVMLDSVQFPNPSLTSRASFGSDNANLKWDQVLTLFVDKMKTLLGEDCPVILACTGESALGTATQVYGGNPLTFAPTMAAPLLSDDVQESVETMILRTKVMEEDKKPTLSPLLNVEDLSAAQVKQTIADCVAGGVESYILYHPDGHYDFGAY